eukprot:2395451-Ditylum_brightwellii.AAC.1
MTNLAPSVEGINKVFPNQLIPRIVGKPTYQQLYEVHKLLMENASSIEATFGGGMHGHLGLVLTPARYMQITRHVFNPSVNPGPNPIMPHPYMTV